MNSVLVGLRRDLLLQFSISPRSRSVVISPHPALGDIAEQAMHDLAGAGLRQVVDSTRRPGRRKAQIARSGSDWPETSTASSTRPINQSEPSKSRRAPAPTR
jgi:hypothetical protein